MKVVHDVVTVSGIEIAVARIDLQDMVIPNPPLDPKDLWFHISTYKAMNPGKGKDASLEIILQPVNDFFDTLDADATWDLIIFYMKAKLITDPENLTQITHMAVIDQLGILFEEVMLKHRLIERLYEMMQTTRLAISSDVPGAGPLTRVQDTEQMTYRETDYFGIHTVALICKMLGPIWGELSHQTKDYITKVNKDMYCVRLLERLSDHWLIREVTRKFRNYVSSIVHKMMTRGQKVDDNWHTSIQNGFTEERFCSTIFAINMVKRFVVVDLHMKNALGEPSCNLMRYVHTSVTQQLTNQLFNMNSKTNSRMRDDIDKLGGEYEGNTSILEYSSRASRSTADKPILTRIGVQLALKKLSEKYRIIPADLEAVVAFHRSHMFAPNPFNRGLVSTFFGQEIGGAYGLQYLDSEHYIRLVAMVQLYLTYRMEDIQVAHLLTSATSPELKTSVRSTIDSRIETNSRNSVEYNLVRKAIPYPVNQKDVTNQLQGIQDWVIRYDHYYNTAPVIFTLLDLEPIPAGAKFEYDEQVMRQVCRFIAEQTRGLVE